jgi:hypothetical protein
MPDDLSVEPYDPAWNEEWDLFVSQSHNGTVYHSRRFLAYHPIGRFEDASLVVREKGRLIAVLPAARDVIGGNTRLRSHPGATYGGLVFKSRERFHRIQAIVSAIVQVARSSGFRRFECLRITPKPYCESASNELEMGLHLNGFVPFRRELTCGLPVVADLTKLLGSKTMWSLRRAERAGVSVYFSEDWESFWRLLEGSLDARHGVKPTHTLMEILDLKTRCGDDIQLLAAVKDGRMISGVVVFICNSRAVYTMYVALDYEFSKLRPNYLCLARLIEWAAQRGYAFLDIGVCTEGDDINWGLYAFKEEFGCAGYFRDSYGLDL